VTNDVFADNAWYFRNALVRANYTNVPKGIGETTEYLEKFFRNLLLGEANVLQSRCLIVGGWKGDETDPTSNPTSDPTSNPTSKSTTSKVKGLQLSLQVRRLLSVLEGEMTRAAIMGELKLKDRVTFVGSYLGPSLKIGLVEMTQPDSPRSPTQRYRLTARGKRQKRKGGAQ